MCILIRTRLPVSAVADVHQDVYIALCGSNGGFTYSCSLCITNIVTNKQNIHIDRAYCSGTALTVRMRTMRRRKRLPTSSMHRAGTSLPGGTTTVVASGPGWKPLLLAVVAGAAGLLSCSASSPPSAGWGTLTPSSPCSSCSVPIHLRFFRVPGSTGTGVGVGPQATPGAHSARFTTVARTLYSRQRSSMPRPVLRSSLKANALYGSSFPSSL